MSYIKEEDSICWDCVDRNHCPCCSDCMTNCVRFVYDDSDTPYEWEDER